MAKDVHPPRGMRDFLPLEKTRRDQVLTTIRETNNLDDDTIAELDSAILKFKKSFQTGQGVPLASVGNETVSALDEEEVDQEQIVRQKR